MIADLQVVQRYLRRMEHLIRRGVIAFLLAMSLALSMSAAGAHAQAGPRRAAITEELGLRLYSIIIREESADAIGEELHRVLNYSGNKCPSVTDFQVFRRDPDQRALKVKCRDRPLYAISVDSSGTVYVDGGDGRIGLMQPADGRVISVYDVRADDYETKAPPVAAEAVETEDVAAETVGAGSRLWLFIGIAILAVLLVMAVYRMIIGEQEQADFERWRWRGLTSVDKDQLLEEAHELYPDIFAHPAGIYIARGRRGKRRLFRTLMFAYLYRSLGLKLGEIR